MVCTVARCVHLAKELLYEKSLSSSRCRRFSPDHLHRPQLRRRQPLANLHAIRGVLRTGVAMLVKQT
jgi:hypothetical protein